MKTSVSDAVGDELAHEEPSVVQHGSGQRELPQSAPNLREDPRRRWYEKVQADLVPALRALALSSHKSDVSRSALIRHHWVPTLAAVIRDRQHATVSERWSLSCHHKGRLGARQDLH